MKNAKLFQYGRSQAVCIPREFRFKGEDEVFVKQVGGAVVLIPKHDPWRPFLESLSEFSADFMEARDQGIVTPRPSPDE